MADETEQGAPVFVTFPDESIWMHAVPDDALIGGIDSELEDSDSQFVPGDRYDPAPMLNVLVASNRRFELLVIV
jgi:hypothetical protein